MATGAGPQTDGCPDCGRHKAGNGLFCIACGQFLTAPPGVHATDLGRRVAAFMLDALVPGTVIVSLVIFLLASVFGGLGNPTALQALVLATLLLWLGYVVWWLIALRHGQTPGKQLMGIRVVRADGSPSGWGWTFLREFGVKGVVIGALGNAVFGLGTIIWIVNLLLAFSDKDRQALHDKVMKTVVVDERAYRQAMREDSQSGL